MRDPKEASGVIVEEAHGICTVALARPKSGNRIDHPFLDELKKVFLKLQDHPPRAVVLTGEGPDFCSGFDLDPEGGFATRLEAGIEHGEALACMEFATQLRGYADMLARLPCLTIAAVEGVCHGAGLELAVACDLRVGAEGSSYRFDHVRYGFMPCMGGVARLLPLVGRSRAIEWVVLAPTISAEEAEANGLIDRRVPQGEALLAAKEMSEGVLKGEPKAIEQALMALRTLGKDCDPAALKLESECAGRTFRGGGVRPGMQRYAKHQAKATQT